MSTPDEQEITLFQKPMEMKLADVLFFAVRKHLIVFKDLTASKHVHYTMVMKGSLLDLHETLEDQGKHIPLAKIEFDWHFPMNRITHEIGADWKSLFRMVKTNDPTWEDLEIEFIPIQALNELLSPVVKGVRWNIDVEFLETLEQSLGYARLGELTKYGFIIGMGSGYLVLSNGTECFLFDMDRMSSIVEESFELSIRKIDLKHYTLSALLWCAKIRLLNIVHSTIMQIRKLTS
jgi:hypothetical protein